MLQQAGLDPVRIEGAAAGTPDVNYNRGWIELKHVSKMPKATQILRIAHFTPEQRAWLMRRWYNDGPCFVLAQVGKSHFLMDGSTAASELGRVPMRQIIEHSLIFWEGKINPQELIEELTKCRFNWQQASNF